MKKFIIPIVIIIIILAIVGGFVGIYNNMVAADQEVAKYASNIDTELQRRNDLIPNLIATVKGYAKHEEGIFTAISDARAQMMSASNMAESATADAAMSSALSRLLAIVENYPDLKANQSFIDLQTQLEGTENRIKVARNNYNDSVQNFNTMVKKFPYNILAGVFGFEAKDFFQAVEGSENVPQVNF